MKRYLFLFSAILFASVQNAHAQDKPRFSDVPVDHWASLAVSRLLETGLAEGDSKDRFHGNNPMTRYEFAVSMARLIDRPVCVPPLPAATKNDIDAVMTRLGKIEERLKGLEEKVGEKKTVADVGDAPTELRELGTEFVEVSQQFASTLKNEAR